MKFTNFASTIILKNICERLLLNIIEKLTQTQVLSCEFCKLFKKTYFLEDLQTAQPRSVLCSYGHQVETSLSSCGSTCTHLGILIAGELEEKEEMKNLLIGVKSPFMS